MFCNLFYKEQGLISSKITNAVANLIQMLQRKYDHPEDPKEVVLVGYKKFLMLQHSLLGLIWPVGHTRHY